MKPGIFDLLILSPQIGICGQRCKHCYVTDNLKQNKPFAEVKMILDGFAETLSEPAITKQARFYTLDELTLYPDIIKLLSYSREINVLPIPTLSTNGSGIASRKNWEEIIQELKKSGVHGFNMSFFGDEEYHDWFTGTKGAFRRSIEATRRAEANGLWVHWNLFLTNENVDQMVQLSRDKGDHRKSYGVPSVVPKWERWSRIHSTIHDFERIPEDQSEFVREDYRSEADWIKAIAAGKLGQSYSPKDKTGNEVKIKTLIESGNILYWGNVYPGHEVGKIKDNSLRDLFESEEKPIGLITEETMDVAAFAKRYGDPNSLKSDSFYGFKTKLLFESLKMR